MDVRPIDFNGMIQNTVEVGNTRAAEDQRPMVQQEFVTMESNREAEVTTTVVHENSNAAEEEAASEGGDGHGYEGNRGRRPGTKKAAAEKKGDGSVRIKPAHPTFNMTV